MDFQHRLLETVQMSHFHMYLTRIVVSHRCRNSSCSGRGSPGSGAIVQHRSGNPQEESTLLQRGVGQTTVTHVPKIQKGASSNYNVLCILILQIMIG